MHRRCPYGDDGRTDETVETLAGRGCAVRAADLGRAFNMKVLKGTQKVLKGTHVKKVLKGTHVRKC